MQGSSIIPVVYIACHGRSGSTLVGSVLGLVEGYVYAGEIREVWRDGLIGNHACGCGKKFRDCHFWSAVFEKAFGGFDTEEAKAATEKFNRIHKAPDAVALLRQVWRFHRATGASEEYTVPLGKLYRAIRDVSGASVIVDSSKSMRYAALLAATPGLDARINNLIRDPRGIIYSERHRARHRDGSEKPASSSGRKTRLLRVIGKCAVRNWLAGRVMERDGGIRLVYEDFVRDQDWYLGEVAGAAAAERVSRRLAEGVGEEVVQHQIAGNWVRGLRIFSGEKWRTELPATTRILAGLLAAPLRASYRSQSYGGRIPYLPSGPMGLLAGVPPKPRTDPARPS